MVIIVSWKTKVDEKVEVAELDSSSLIHSVPSSLDSAPSSQTQKLVVGWQMAFLTQIVGKVSDIAQNFPTLVSHLSVFELYKSRSSWWHKHVLFLASQLSRFEVSQRVDGSSCKETLGLHDWPHVRVPVSPAPSQNWIIANANMRSGTKYMVCRILERSPSLYRLTNPKIFPPSTNLIQID